MMIYRAKHSRWHYASVSLTVNSDARMESVRNILSLTTSAVPLVSLLLLLIGIIVLLSSEV